jgi:hypothetical protein
MGLFGLYVRITNEEPTHSVLATVVSRLGPLYLIGLNLNEIRRRAKWLRENRERSAG